MGHSWERRIVDVQATRMEVKHPIRSSTASVNCETSNLTVVGDFRMLPHVAYANDIADGLWIVPHL
jgi:hypothetical protein